MGSTVDTLDAIARRCDDLAPLAPTLVKIVADGNRRMMLDGRETDGSNVASLAASTLKHRRGPGPRGVPRYDQSRPITALHVVAEARTGQLTIRKTWPGFPGIAQLGRSIGFRPEDLDAVARAHRDYTVKGRADG